jgi:hypothetical protein
MLKPTAVFHALLEAVKDTGDGELTDIDCGGGAVAPCCPVKVREAGVTVSRLVAGTLDRTTFPILLPAYSVNQMLPSGPGVIPNGSDPLLGIVYWVRARPGVILPIVDPPASHRLPSGPSATPWTAWPAVG